MRHLYIVIDLSSCMIEKDLKPNRLSCCIRVRIINKLSKNESNSSILNKQLLEKFIHSFFDQNPISQLGVIVSYNKKAEKLCDTMGNPRKIVDKLKTLNEKLCTGEISIQNSLEVAMKTLQLPLFFYSILILKY